MLDLQKLQVMFKNKIDKCDVSLLVDDGFKASANHDYVLDYYIVYAV